MSLLFLLSAQPAAAQDDSLAIHAGRMIMVGFRGLTADAASPIVRDIRALHLGGVILFDYDVEQKSPQRNIASPAQVRALCAELHAAAPDGLLIGIDQEGGRVNRLKEKFGFPPSPSAAALGASDDTAATRRAGDEIGALLASLGIDVNFAPVLDVNVNPDNPVIGRLGRSYSADPRRVALHGAVVVHAMHDHGILCAVKHFPGHGSSSQDSHEGFVDVTAHWTRAELAPFADVLRTAGPDMVMTAHIVNRRLDSLYPATLSRAVVGGLLRGELGFRGVVVSDDMQMRAIRDHYTLDDAIARAVNAGVDLLVFGNNTGVYEPDIARRAQQAILRLVAAGRIPRARVEEAGRRIAALRGAHRGVR